jgi:hypothetical protein
LASKYIVVTQRAHNSVVNVQPSPLSIAVSVLVEYVDRIVPAACGFAVVVKHPIELVVHLLHRFPSNRCDDFWTDRATGDP